MFGVNVKKIKPLLDQNNFINIDYYKEQYYNIYNQDIERWPDQDFLKNIIYPIIKNDNLSHISYDNLRYSDNNILIAINNNHIGMVIEPTLKI